MGVDYYTCDSCGRAFDSYEEYNMCDNCDYTWCELCAHPEQLFYVGDEIHCRACYTPGVRPILQEELITYMCNKYGTTLEDITQEFKETEQYQRGLETYECTECNLRPHCSELGAIIRPRKNGDYGESEYSKGVCCVCKEEKYRILLDQCKYCVTTTLKLHLDPICIGLRLMKMPLDLIHVIENMIKTDSEVLRAWSLLGST